MAWRASRLSRWTIYASLAVIVLSIASIVLDDLLPWWFMGAVLAIYMPFLITAEIVTTKRIRRMKRELTRERSNPGPHRR